MPSLHTANRSPIPILMYHQIETAASRGSAFRSLYVSPSAFARQMAWLHFLGFRALSISALMPYLNGKRRGKVVGLTFDDGYLNNFTHALPVLLKHGFSATCYAVSQHVGKTNSWDRDAGIAPAPLMSAAQLRHWCAAGQEVGAHSRHHPRLTQLDAPRCQQEISGSKAELEDMTGSAVRHFCYPYGDYNADQAVIARAAGFESATTTQRSRCQTHENIMQLPRVPVVRSTTLPLLWLKVATGYEDRRRQ